MQAGAAAVAVCFQLSSSFGGLLPADLDGATLPPTGSNEFFLNFGKNSLNLWKFHADFTTTSNSRGSRLSNSRVASKIHRKDNDKRLPTDREHFH